MDHTRFQSLLAKIREFLVTVDQADLQTAVDAIRAAAGESSPMASQPVDSVRWVPVEQVEPNDYNPNSVARIEMRLLHTSIAHDGYTQPIVTVLDHASGKFVIVDGFHRYFVAKNYPDIRERNRGLVPVVVIDKPINDRMASTVRHNRARGKHSIEGMANMVYAMLAKGWPDERICQELGMEPEELLRLKHLTGFSKLFADVEYTRAWQTHKQIQAAMEHKRKVAEAADGQGTS